MKIAFLLTQSLESPSGLGRYRPLGRALAALGHQVTIYALHPDYPTLSAREFAQGGVRVRYVAPMHVRKRGNLKSYYSPGRLIGVAARATWQLSRAALRSEAEIIHVGKPHPMNSIAGLAARFFQRRRVFLDCDDLEAASGNFGAGWQKAVVAFFEDQVPKHVDRLTTNTRTNELRLLSLGIPPERILYLPNGVDPARFALPSPEQTAALRARLGLGGRRVVAYVGSLSLASHPVDLLLEAFSQVLPSCPEAVLLLAGGGEDYERLQQQAGALGLGGAVRFLGRVSPEEVVQVYALAEVSVDPVRDNDAARGRSPLKLFESWACGVPFASAAVGDRAELLGDPPAGLLAAPGSAGSLAAAIRRLLTEPDLAEACRRRGLERAHLYTWEVLARRLERFYLEATPHA